MTFNAVQAVVHAFLNSSWLSTVYVSVNAYRSLFPVKLIERECLTAMSNPLMDRSLATVGEMCFAKQLSDSLYAPSWVVFYAWAAQLCAWYGTLTKDYLFLVYSETLWFMIGYIYYVRSADYSTAKVISAIYCFYMFWVHIPLYAYRFIETDPVPLEVGMLDVQQCVKGTDWDDEYVWRTGYFVGGSWVSIFLG